MTDISEPLKNELILLAKIVDFSFARLKSRCPYLEDTDCLHNHCKGFHCSIENCPLIDQDK